ncbi:hypothetical protein [Novosphingobium sp.]|uniref:hypothetical protein n=1 Tax=Novosphingobium sp. TaxID=1874826 RepID=UPI0025E8BA81|nr:hypothetical protein [Novosphingobium sp.]
MSAQIVSALAAFGLIGAGVAGSVETRAIDAVPVTMAMMGGGQAAAGGKCRVDVFRTGNPGNADITRQVLDNGNCVCTVMTGPAPSNGGAEDVVKALLRERTCDSAPLTSATGNGVGAPVAAAASTGGGSAAVLPVVVGVAGAAGLAVALGKSSKG